MTVEVDKSNHKPSFLKDYVVFNKEDYESIFDEYSESEGAFKALNRGLRIFDPLTGMFVKFNKKSAVLTTNLSTLFFRQSYGSYHYVFEVDLVLKKIVMRLYERKYMDVIDHYQKIYKDISSEAFIVKGNE